MAAKKPSLSVYVVTHNEEAVIKRCIESIYDLADEIVIIDGESDDATVKIAQSLGKKVRVIHEKNPANFIENKQKALNHVKGDWILELDADELVTPELKKEIRSALTSGVGTVGYYIPRLNHFLGKPLWKGGQYPDLKLRLYRAGVGAFPCESVHDTLQLFEVDGKLPKTEILKNPLMHFPYATVGVYMRKTVQYAEFEAQTLASNGQHAGLFSYFFVKPVWWFLLTYIRHRGYKDGIPGFAFSLFSATRYWFTYTSLYERQTRRTGA